MATNYVLFSEGFKVNPSPELGEWIRCASGYGDPGTQWATARDPRAFDAPWREDNYPQCYIHFDGSAILVYSEDGGSVEHAVALVQALWQTFGPHDDTWGKIEWAETCSKARPGEFGGGCVVFNEHEAHWRSTGESVRRLIAKHAPKTTRYRNGYAVITEFRNCSIDVEFYRTPFDATVAVAKIIENVVDDCREFSEETRKNIHEAFAAGNAERVYELWNEAESQQDEDFIHIAQTRLYSTVKPLRKKS